MGCVRKMKSLSARELPPPKQIRIPPANPKCLQDSEILRTFAIAIASAVDGNRPQQPRITNNTYRHKPFAYLLYIHWRAMLTITTLWRRGTPSALPADTCAPAHDRLAEKRTHSRTRPEDSRCENQISAVRRRALFFCGTPQSTFSAVRRRALFFCGTPQSLTILPPASCRR